MRTALVAVAAGLLIIAAAFAARFAGYKPTPYWCEQGWLADCTKHRPWAECRGDQKTMGCTWNE